MGELTMKRLINVCLVLGMLLFFVLPVSVGANSTPTKTPFDWLTDEEKAYVTTIRAADAEARVQYAKIMDLIWGYQNNQEWSDQMKSAIAATDAEIVKLCNTAAPPDFAKVAKKYQSIAVNIFVPPNWCESFRFTSLLDMAHNLQAAEMALDNVAIPALDNCLTYLESTIVDVAGKRILYDSSGGAPPDTGKGMGSCSLSPSKSPSVKASNYSIITLWIHVTPEWKINGAMPNAYIETLSYIGNSCNGKNGQGSVDDIDGKWTSATHFEANVEYVYTSDLYDVKFTENMIVDFSPNLSEITSLKFTAALTDTRKEQTTTITAGNIKLGHISDYGIAYYKVDGTDVAKPVYNLSVKAKEVFKDGTYAETNSFKVDTGSTINITFR
jgi:hypothetical protein